ncbi:MAG: GNAT family N-acetyltransferase [Proteobacteria bacterium]|nr:GNAT family N-acetyltransferase [Pseudomonadota bacterium]MBS0572907.1 GNAT family N-acetyltransferase [Pseudomonadota bacterium]
MGTTLILRRAVPGDLGAVERLLQRSYPKLLAADYPPSLMVMAVPLLARAQPGLLASGRYFVAEGAGGRMLAAGGWSGGRDGQGEVRHVATDPDATRRGIGRALMEAVLGDARAAGVSRMLCLATRTAVPFYRALGFEEVGPVLIGLRPGIEFPAVRMARAL